MNKRSPVTKSCFKIQQRRKRKKSEYVGRCDCLVIGNICCDLLVKYGGKMGKKAQGQRGLGNGGGLVRNPREKHSLEIKCLRSRGALSDCLLVESHTVSNISGHGHGDLA